MADEQTAVTEAEEAQLVGMGGGIRMADRRWHLEKHAIFGKHEALKNFYTRPWGSQPMNVDVKTGALKGCPHPEQKAIDRSQQTATAAVQIPTQEIDMVQAYGR